ncbi:hypothetical protein FK519_28220 [Klebsiella pneumoniae]|nr:hypothetical protein [Klebsiella pneumoniae]
MSKPCSSGKARSPDVCGAVDALGMGGEEQQELVLLALSVWEQSSEVRDFSGFFSVGAQVQLVVNVEALLVRESPEP